MAQSKTDHIIVKTDDGGEWRHASGSDYLFMYLAATLSPDIKETMVKAFEDAIVMPSTIKNAIKNTTGQEVVQGLYLQDPAEMTNAMNSIEGMGQTKDDSGEESGNGTAVSINQQFFAGVLAGLGGDVAPMMDYLTKSMGDVQVELKNQTKVETFGTIIGMISLMPVLNVPVTTFTYVYSNSTTSSWMVKVNCGSSEHYSYDYKYQTIEYNYSPNGGLEEQKYAEAEQTNVEQEVKYGIPDGWYSIQNTNSNLFIDVPHNKPDKDLQLVQFEATGLEQQKFFIHQLGDGLYTIKTKNGLYWDIKGGSKDDGGILMQHPLNGNHGTANQQFRFVEDGTGAAYYIFNRNSGKAIDVPDSSMDNEAKLQQYTPNGSGAQRFRVLIIK